MLDDFTPIIHDLEGRTVRIYPVADVHIGAKEAALGEFEKFLRDKVAADPDAYLVLVGDVVNNGIRSATCPTDIYDEAIASPRAQVDKAVELLEPVADRILAAVGGNHEARSRKTVDLDPMYEIMCLLRIPHLYRQNMAFMRVRLAVGGVKDIYSMLLVHGKSEPKMRRFETCVEGVDAIVHAHLHKGSVAKPARVVFNHRNTVSVKPLVSVCATSWLEWGGYASAALLPPAATSDPQALVLEFTGSNDINGGIHTIW